jgi:hypothetical protein
VVLVGEGFYEPVVMDKSFRHTGGDYRLAATTRRLTGAELASA